MNTFTLVTIMALMSAAVILPLSSHAEAMKADTSDRLSPKSYGVKTNSDFCSIILCKIMYKNSDHQSKLAKEDWQRKRIAEFLAKYPKPLHLS